MSNLIYKFIVWHYEPNVDRPTESAPQKDEIFFTRIAAELFISKQKKPDSFFIHESAEGLLKVGDR